MRVSGAAGLNWESLWAPYDEVAYQQTLVWVEPDDVALGIGVDDLRLARRLDLRQPRQTFALVPYGWYACICGGVGFVPGLPDALAWADLDIIHEVTGCPQCDETGAVSKTAPVLISTRNTWSAS
ncbi:MAG: hypothetical protein Fur0021_05020 [Candidatus Promineifilaceae bacterium]